MSARTAATSRFITASGNRVSAAAANVAATVTSASAVTPVTRTRRPQPDRSTDMNPPKTDNFCGFYSFARLWPTAPVEKIYRDPARHFTSLDVATRAKLGQIAAGWAELP